MNGLKFLRKAMHDQKGATATEYVVMITLVLLVVFATVVFLGLKVEGAFNTFTAMFTGS